MAIDDPLPPPRQPLGLPAGSVRSLLTLMVVAMICILVLTTSAQLLVPPIKFLDKSTIAELENNEIPQQLREELANKDVELGPGATVELVGKDQDPHGRPLRAWSISGGGLAEPLTVTWTGSGLRVFTGGRPFAIPPYLVYLLFMIIASFFAAQGYSMNQGEGASAPLGLPGFVVPLLVVGGLAATVTYKLMYQPEALEAQFDSSLELAKQQPYLPLVILGGFVFGYFVQWIVPNERQSPTYQDIVAWLALISLIGMLIHAAIMGINHTLPVGDQIRTTGYEQYLSGLVAFYFGARC